METSVGSVGSSGPFSGGGSVSVETKVGVGSRSSERLGRRLPTRETVGTGFSHSRESRTRDLTGPRSGVPVPT